MICSGVNPFFFILPASLCHIEPEYNSTSGPVFLGGAGQPPINNIGGYGMSKESVHQEVIELLSTVCKQKTLQLPTLFVALKRY
jgi:hypothetical protein